MKDEDRQKGSLDDKGSTRTLKGIMGERDQEVSSGRGMTKVWPYLSSMNSNTTGRSVPHVGDI